MYELRLNGRSLGRYDTPEPALARVRLLSTFDRESEPEIIDTRTGRAFEVAASVRWRDELMARIR